MQLHKSKIDHYYNLFEDAKITKEYVKIYENYYEINDIRLEDVKCCCGVSYRNVFIDGIIFKPYEITTLPYEGPKEMKYRRFKFWGPITPYYMICEQYNRNGNTTTKEPMFKCQYGNDRFDNRVLSEKDTQISDAKFRRESPNTYVLVL